MKKIVAVALAILCALPLVAADGMKKVSKANAGKKIAVVSMAANNYGGKLQGWNEANSSDLMKTRMNKMLLLLEQNLSSDWTVVNAETFVAKEAYQSLAGEDREVGVPEYKGARMRLFGKDRKDLVKAKVDAEIIKKLAAVAGADYVLVVYSEWSVAIGKMVPTSKALAKNVVALYDKDGKLVFTGRKDQMGTTTLGAYGKVVVNDETIDEWVGAFNEGVKFLLTN